MLSQKVLVFIDTNIYLRFYDSKQSNFKKLLRSIEEIDKYIFISKQIINEIDRNKQELFKRSFEGYINQSRLVAIELPEHISGNLDGKISSWNNKRNKIETIGKSQTKQLQEISNEMLNEILKGDDEISKVLNKISGDIESPKKKVIRKAKDRKELGNPPGKKDDPIGDQLNWELLLEMVADKDIEDLIIISADNDFFISINERIQLNSLLYKELEEINSDINIYCYNTLTEGLKKFNAIKEIKNLPNSEELEKIRSEEVETLPNTNYSTYSQWNLPNQGIYGDINPQYGIYGNLNPGNYLAFPLPNSLVRRCPKCKTQTLTANEMYMIEDKFFRTYECQICGHKESHPFLN